MAMGNSKKNRIQVVITKDGITITKQDNSGLPWKVEQDWEEVSSVIVDSTEKNLFSAESNEGQFPITIKNGEIRIGEEEAKKDKPLAYYTNENQDTQEQNKKEYYWLEIEEKTQIQYIPDEDRVVFPEESQLTDVFSTFIQFLFNNDYMADSDLPWATPRARTNYVLNTEPIHKNGEEMDAVEPVPGVYFDRKIPRDQRERHVKQLVNEFLEE